MKSKKVYLIETQDGKKHMYAKFKQTKEQEKDNLAWQRCSGCAFDWTSSKCGINNEEELSCRGSRIYVRVVELSPTTFQYLGKVYSIKKRIDGVVDMEWWIWSGGLNIMV